MEDPNQTLILDLSLPSLPAMFSFFLAVYVTAYFIVFRNWSPKIRPEASSCLISLAHGTPAVFLSSFAILSDHRHVSSSFDDTRFAATNTRLQNSVLEFSVAYFLTDLLHYLVFFPSDVLFIGHHLATLFVFLTCRYCACRGAFAVLTLLVLAEVTSLCQNVWTLANARRNDAVLAARVYDLLSPPFYVLYSIVRGVVGPYFVYRMSVFYVFGGAEGLIPRWVWVSWIVVVAAAISVSIMWISNLWVELCGDTRSKSKKLEMKVR